MKDSYEVVIIGGGLAGLSLAYFLKELGDDVIILDRFPIEKRLNFSSAGTIKDIIKLFPIAKKAIINSWRRICIHLKGNTIEFGFKKTMGYVLDYNLLLEEILKNVKADVDFNTTVKKVDINTSIVHTNKGKIFGKYIIDASGNSMILSKFLNILFKKVVIGYEYWISDQPEDSLRFYLGRYYVKNGYGWIFPGKNYVKVGIGGEFKYGKKYLDLFLKKIGKEKDKIIRYHCRTLPLGVTKNVIYRNVAYLGDSAMQANPLGGEGIRHILILSKKLADAIILNNSNIYQRFWEKEYLPIWKDCSNISLFTYKILLNLFPSIFENLITRLNPKEIFNLLFHYKFAKDRKQIIKIVLKCIEISNKTLNYGKIL